MSRWAWLRGRSVDQRFTRKLYRASGVISADMRVCGSSGDQSGSSCGERSSKVKASCSGVPGLGVVDDERLARGAVQLHTLVAQAQVADVGVVEDLVAAGVGPDLVAIPQPRKMQGFSGQALRRSAPGPGRPAQARRGRAGA